MQKIKLFIESERGKDILIILIIIFIGISSFCLGRLSNQNSVNGVKIEYTEQGANVTNTQNNEQISLNPSISDRIKSSGGSYFASKRGKKYYPANCSAGKSIKQENKIYFQTSSEAEQQGYELSNSCN